MWNYSYDFTVAEASMGAASVMEKSLTVTKKMKKANITNCTIFYLHEI